MPLKVLFFRTGSGNEPVREWLQEQSKKVRLTVGSDIRTVQVKGPVIGMPLVRSLGGGLWEVRSTEGVEYRVFFFVLDGTMYLLHGIIKKTQRTAQGDLDLARERMEAVKEKDKLEKAKAAVAKKKK